MLDLARYPDEAFSAPLNTKKQEPVTERQKSFHFNTDLIIKIKMIKIVILILQKDNINRNIKHSVVF